MLVATCIQEALVRRRTNISGFPYEEKDDRVNSSASGEIEAAAAGGMGGRKSAGGGANSSSDDNFDKNFDNIDINIKDINTKKGQNNSITEEEKDGEARLRSAL